MLERLNGNEKGDAIVSVRGYEPIWTVFTPSYELKKVYFNNGKADIGKREAVLFEKKDYVFDISGGNEMSEEDRILDEIEKSEQSLMPTAPISEDKLKKLDEQWSELLSGINERIEQYLRYLKGKDAKAVKAARLENKVPLLYALTEEYEQTTALKLKNLADYISGELPKLTALQNSATK